MRRGVSRFFVSAFCLASALAAVLVFALPAHALGKADTAAAKSVFAAIHKDQWKAARDQARRIHDATFTTLFHWLDYSRADSDADFETIARFVSEHPDWPSPVLLRRRAEEAITNTTPPGDVLKWFEAFPPVSTDGFIHRAAALLATGQAEAGRAAVRSAWIDGNFGTAQEKHFYARYRKLLTADDHRTRLERLLWSDRYWPARRMLGRVDAETRALAEARLALMHRRGGVDAAIARVPKELRDHPGLIYERMRWRRRKGRYDSARELLIDPPEDQIVAEKWWVERTILARKALESGLISEAGRLAKEHGLTPGGSEYAEAEWFAGWVALRFLKDDAEAFGHFVNLFRNVSYPISRARGAYWAGRAAEAMGRRDLAENWYGVAASHPTTYYGQLALSRIRPGAALRLPQQPIVADSKAFDADSLVQATRLLAQLGESEQLRPFIVSLAEHGDDVGWRVQTAELARACGRPDLGIHVAKISDRDGHPLIEHGYPTLADLGMTDATSQNGVELPLVLALIRQESAFLGDAISSAGAQGLMQIMPATARRVANAENIRYRRSRLTTSPAYNLRLGQAYLAGLLDDFNGSYVLTLAAYNAGPSRAREWMREYGDPRDPEVDVIDWIETIPFRETRNYVQRVLENLQIYRQLLTDTEVAIALPRDLER